MREGKRRARFQLTGMAILWYIGTESKTIETDECGAQTLKYKSCAMIENFYLNINGRIDTGDNCLTLCCENVRDVPGTALCESSQQSLEGFRRKRAEIIAESVRLSLLGGSDDERNFPAGCAECANFVEGEHGNFDGLIHYVNLSCYPAPCQCKCIYCDVHCGESGRFDRRLHAEYYGKLFDMLDYARETGRIAPNARWQVSSGEIAIHPYKDRIFSLVRDQAATFYTNCFLFEEGVAANLSANPNSAINLSIDAGTPKTWHKVKGVDNFEAVTTNLVKYYGRSARPGQISLKYIVLPGINNTQADYFSVIEIMKILKVPHLTVSRDMREKYTLTAEQREMLIGAAGYLVAMLHKNRMTLDMFTYTPEERERVAALANSLLQTGKV